MIFSFRIVINAVDSHGKNALHYAIDYGNENLVELFLAYPHCDPNFRDRDQLTPLHLAVKRNNPNIISLLLSDQHQIQADANAINRNGQTPLHMAATVGYVEVIRALLQADLEEPCNPTILDSQQLTAFQLAKANHQDICAKLIDEYQQGWTKLSPRKTSESIDEHEINPVVMNPAGHLDDDEFESSEQSSTSEESGSSQQIHRPPNKFSGGTVPSTKPESRTLADLIKTNPLQSEINKTNVSKPANQTLAGLTHSIPVQPDGNLTNTTKPSNQTATSPIHNVSLQPDINKATLIKPDNQGLSSLIHHVQPNDTSYSKPVICKCLFLLLFFNATFVLI
jgi:hypothetical protein